MTPNTTGCRSDRGYVHLVLGMGWTLTAPCGGIGTPPPPPPPNPPHRWITRLRNVILPSTMYRVDSHELCIMQLELYSTYLFISKLMVTLNTPQACRNRSGVVAEARPRTIRLL